MASSSTSDTIVLDTTHRQTLLRHEDIDGEIEQLLIEAEIRLRARSTAGQDGDQKAHSAEPTSDNASERAHNQALQFKYVRH